MFVYSNTCSQFTTNRRIQIHHERRMPCCSWFQCVTQSSPSLKNLAEIHSSTSLQVDTASNRHLHCQDFDARLSRYNITNAQLQKPLATITAISVELMIDKLFTEARLPSPCPNACVEVLGELTAAMDDVLDCAHGFKGCGYYWGILDVLMRESG